MTTFLHFETLEACPVCGSSNIRSLTPPDLARCGACQTFFRNPRPTQAEIARSYDAGKNYQQWQLQKADRSDMWNRRVSLIRRYKTSGSLLDIGVGDGHFLDVAKDAGFQTYGTELSEVGANYARDRGHDINVGQFSAIEYPLDYFDVITIWHVLEHVPDPMVVVTKAISHLKPRGILVIAVPNENNALLKNWLRASTQHNPFGALVWGGEIHLTHFQPTTMRRFLERAGVTIKEFGVDDIYLSRTPLMRLKKCIWDLVSLVIQTHYAVAMYFVAEKRC